MGCCRRGGAGAGGVEGGGRRRRRAGAADRRGRGGGRSPPRGAWCCGVRLDGTGAERIVGNPVPRDETQTVHDEAERHGVVWLSFECSSGERTPDVPRFSSDSVAIRSQRPVREVLVQASVRAMNTSLPLSKPITMTVADLDSNKHGQSESL